MRVDVISHKYYAKVSTCDQDGDDPNEHLKEIVLKEFITTREDVRWGRTVDSWMYFLCVAAVCEAVSVPGGMKP